MTPERALDGSRDRCFPPVVDARTRVLVLGSLPSAVSLAQGQYYAHPRNRFWHLLGAVLGEDLPGQSYDARLRTLLDHGIGLWDVVAEARREGSLDGNIREHASNDLVALVDSLPRLVVIAFNGGTASRIGSRALAPAARRGCAELDAPHAVDVPQGPERAARPRLHLIDLPSSSPAYTRPFADKLLAWEALRKWLPAQT